MRPKGMNRSLLPLALLTTSVLVAGCGASSGSTAAGASTTGATTPAPGATSLQATSPAPLDTSIAAAPPTTGAVPAATSATLTYVGPQNGRQRLKVTKKVTGATYQRLTQDLQALKPMAGMAQCMVLTGETAAITLTAQGHTTVYTVEGAACRGVAVTKDGVAQPRLASSTVLVNQVRAIAGYTGIMQPKTG